MALNGSQCVDNLWNSKRHTRVEEESVWIRNHNNGHILYFDEKHLWFLKKLILMSADFSLPTSDMTLLKIEKCVYDSFNVSQREIWGHHTIMYKFPLTVISYPCITVNVILDWSNCFSGNNTSTGFTVKRNICCDKIETFFDRWCSFLCQPSSVDRHPSVFSAGDFLT